MHSIKRSLLTSFLVVALIGCTGGDRGDIVIVEEPVEIDKTLTIDHFLQFSNEQAALAAGNYVIVVATATAGEADNYSLTATFDDGTTQSFSGSWTSSGGMDPAADGNPRHQISLSVAGGLTLALSSSVDNYLYLLLNEHVIAENDDSGAGSTNAAVSLENSQINAATYARAYYQAIDPLDERTTLQAWKTLNGFDSGADTHITFRDRIDLGYGRDMYSKTKVDGSIAIYVDNYIVEFGEGDATSYGPLSLDAALEADQRFYIGTNAIEFSPAEATDPNSDKIVKIFTFNPAGDDDIQQRTIQLDMDGRGNKFIPTVCMICHGGPAYPLNPDGTFSAVSLRSLKMNALDPNHFTFSEQPEFTEEDLQAGMKSINQLVHSSFESVAARDDSNRGKWSANLALDISAGAYGGDFSAETYDKDYIPPGWRQASNRPSNVEKLYLDVIKKHCIACHSLLGTNSGENIEVSVDGSPVSLANAINFSSYEKFISYNERIIDQVFRRGSMPLSLLNYSKFWEDPAGAPTLLASTLQGFDIFDDNGLISEPQTPVAIPGEDRTATSPTTLNASASLLTETYSWKLISTPDGSTATIDPASGSITTLTADTDGEYVIELTASNAANLSDTNQTTITIDSTLNPTPEQLTFVADIQPILTGCASCHIDGGFFKGIPVSFHPSNPLLYEHVRERLNLLEPVNSLLLQKPTNAQHGGGISINRDTIGGEATYQTILNWVTNGAPCGDDPLVCDT